VGSIFFDLDMKTIANPLCATWHHFSATPRRLADVMTK
jgi:hypothetical protein